MITKKQAKMLKRPYTIDLRGIMAQEYLNSKKTNMEKLKENTLKYIGIIGIILYILISFGSWGGFITISKTNASEPENLSFLAHFPETKKEVIGCYNDRTGKIREAKKCNIPGDHNIILPPQTQIKIWLKYFNEFEIINRLALVNFESSFNPNAENYWAKGYVQTLKKYKIASNIDSQLKWLYNRQKYQKGKKYCGRYWTKYNYRDNQPAGEYGVLACLYRYHFHAYKGGWYAKRGIKTTKFYKYYMFGIKN